MQINDVNNTNNQEIDKEPTWFQKNKKKIVYVGCGVVLLTVEGILLYKHRESVKLFLSHMCNGFDSERGKKVVTKVLINNALPVNMEKQINTIVECKKLIPSDVKMTGRQLTATDLGRKALCSAREINRRIVEKGFAKRDLSGELCLTEIGKVFGEMKWKMTKYQHVFTNIEWDEAILPFLFDENEMMEISEKMLKIEKVLGTKTV